MARGHLCLDPKPAEADREELAAAFAAFGLQHEDDFAIEQDEFWLWPENEEVFWLWVGLQTQWVVGMAGAVGLNYAGVEANFRMLGIPKKRIRDIYLLIKHLEQTALDVWASKR